MSERKGEDERNSGKKRFRCSYCDKDFLITGHLHRHERSHTGEKPHVCPQPGCDKSYARSDNLNRHMQSHVPEEERVVFKCAIAYCGREFAKERGLRKHMKVHENGPANKCDYCGDCFMKKWQLNKHLADKHGAQLPFECRFPECKARFARQIHVHSHEKRKHNKYYCLEKDCEEVPPFSSLKEFQKHQNQRHTDATVHKCKQCDMSFDRPNRLKRHEKTHILLLQERRTFKCNFSGCKSAFVNNWNLKAHIRVNHEDTSKFSCPQCSNNFCSRMSLNRHLKVIHFVSEEEIETVTGHLQRVQRRPSIPCSKESLSLSKNEAHLTSKPEPLNSNKNEILSTSSARKKALPVKAVLIVKKSEPNFLRNEDVPDMSDMENEDPGLLQEMEAMLQETDNIEDKFSDDDDFAGYQTSASSDEIEDDFVEDDFVEESFEHESETEEPFYATKVHPSKRCKTTMESEDTFDVAHFLPPKDELFSTPTKERTLVSTGFLSNLDINNILETFGTNRRDNSEEDSNSTPIGSIRPRLSTSERLEQSENSSCSAEEGNRNNSWSPLRMKIT